jgi:hypothetical protein
MRISFHYISSIRHFVHRYFNLVLARVVFCGAQAGRPPRGRRREGGNGDGDSSDSSSSGADSDDDDDDDDDDTSESSESDSSSSDSDEREPAVAAAAAAAAAGKEKAVGRRGLGRSSTKRRYIVTSGHRASLRCLF